MQLYKDNLGKVAITVEQGYWSIKKDYDKLTIVQQEGVFGTFISRKPVPAGTELTDRVYWIPFSSLKESIVLDYNAFIAKYQHILDSNIEEIANIKSRLDVVEDLRHQVIDAILDSNVAIDTANEAIRQANEALTRVTEQLETINQLKTEIEEDKQDIEEAIEEFKTSKGKPNGIAPLNTSGLIDSQYLPSFVDDVLEFTSVELFPNTGEQGKIYIDTTTNKQYRWSGSQYVELLNNENVIYLGNFANRDEAFAEAAKREYTENSKAAMLCWHVNNNVFGVIFQSCSDRWYTVQYIFFEGAYRRCRVRCITTGDDYHIGDWQDIGLFKSYKIEENAGGIDVKGVYVQGGYGYPIQNEEITLFTIPFANDNRTGLFDANYHRMLSTISDITKGILFGNIDVVSTDLSTVSLGYTIYNNLRGAVEKSVTIPSATNSAAGLMTAADKTKLDSIDLNNLGISPEDKQSLDTLRDMIFGDKSSVTITANKTTIEKGVDTQVTLNWSYKFNNVVVDKANLTSMNLIQGDQTLVSDKTVSTATYTLNDTKTYMAEGVYQGITKNASVTIRAYYPIYFGESTATTVTSANILAMEKQAIKASPAGNYTYEVRSDGYVWLCVPNGMTINKVTSSGFDVPFEAATNVEVTGKGTYKCYRSSSKFAAGVFTFTIA